MTTPKQARQISGGRTYAWPPLPPHEFEVISVTNAKDNYPKAWLTGWAVKMTAERAVDQYELLGQMIEADERDALKWLKGARWSSSGAKADRGTIVHSALESYLAGRPIDKAAVQEALDEKRVPRALHRGAFGMIEGLLQYLDDTEPEVFWSESTVYSRTHRYAGTPDIVARVNVGGSRVPAILDVKTSKDIYDDTGLQLVAYARAEFVGLDDGTEAPLTPDGESIDYGVVIRPTASGKHETATFALSDDLHDVFLNCLALSYAEHEGVLRKARRPS